jgi:glutaredoxin 3
MKTVTVYSTNYCPYCMRAKSLLESKNIPYTEVNLEGKPAELAELKQRTGMRTVPQIFIGEELIGGFSELSALAQADELDAKLKD